MNISKLILAICVCAIIASCSSKTTETEQTVNAVIGDISFLETFGHKPTEETSEQVRLQTHLKYVEQMLRNKKVSGLSNEQEENRQKLLGLLNEYWTAGVFPKNYDYPDQRIPCFIDKDGNICAVGYLIEKTVGRHVAEEINAKYQYEYLLAMNDQTIDGWVESSGFTKEELAMIQPSYTPVRSKYVSPANAVSSSIFGGVNISINAVNAIQIGKGTDSKVTPIIGLVTGVGQVFLGAIKYPTLSDGYVTTEYLSGRKLSLFNIGLGTSTIALSTWNLIANRTRKEKSMSYNIYGFPTQDGSMAVGFSLSKRF